MALYNPSFAQEPASSLWTAYNDIFRTAKYIDLTHAFEPRQAVWPGFATAKFKPALAGQTMEGYVEAGHLSYVDTQTADRVQNTIVGRVLDDQRVAAGVDPMQHCRGGTCHADLRRRFGDPGH